MENSPITITVEKARYVALLERALGIRKSEDGSPKHVVLGRKLSRIGNDIERNGENTEAFQEAKFDLELVFEYFHLSE